ncbi:MAG: DNA polymerase III subunit delta [Tepidisphaeraceae bacterium]
MPSPVYAIIGDDIFLQLEALQGVLQQMPADVQRVDVDGESAQLADTLDELRSFSMFGGHKLVVVRNADDFISKYRAQMEDYLAAPSDSGSLVLRVASLPKNQRIYKLIDKVGKAIACEPPKLDAIPGWVIRRGKQAHGVMVQDDAAKALADLIGVDLGRLDNELAKLALQAKDGTVRAADVSTTVAYQREQEMWELTDALTLGRPDEAVRRWRHLVAADPSTEFRAVTWLVMWLEKSIRALAMKRQRMNPFAIAKELRIWPANNVDKLLVTCEKLGEHGLKSAVERLVTVDRKNKSGLGDPVTNVEQFLLTMR